ncbi:hypothetical protein [Mycobacterium uberis]|uniref:hypothetical protein n=1 Tax=Mycobacterium uberis TaxID=2162698 RepID=UPI000E308629|nr:hypothetical protein [Mycobacterium uberis]
MYSSSDYFDVSVGMNASESARSDSAISDELVDAYTSELAVSIHRVNRGEWRSLTLFGSALVTVFIVGVTALVVSLAISIRPTVGVRLDPCQQLAILTR